MLQSRTAICPLLNTPNEGHMLRDTLLGINTAVWEKKKIWHGANMSHRHTDHPPVELTVSKSRWPSRTGNLEGRKSVQLCSSSAPLDSDKDKTEMCFKEALIRKHQQHKCWQTAEPLRLLQTTSNETRAAQKSIQRA